MILPGFASKPPPLPATVPVVTREDPAIAEARKKLKTSELRRKGRRSTIISGGAGVVGDAPLSQPQAGSAQVLG